MELFLEPTWSVLAASWAVWKLSEALPSALGASRKPFWTVFGRLGSLLGASWGISERSRAAGGGARVWGPSGDRLGPSWAALEAVLGTPWAITVK
eukprot:6306207-Pyramimonas_sp.AAC.1